MTATIKLNCSATDTISKKIDPLPTNQKRVFTVAVLLIIKSLKLKGIGFGLNILHVFCDTHVYIYNHRNIKLQSKD